MTNRRHLIKAGLATCVASTVAACSQAGSPSRIKTAPLKHRVPYPLATIIQSGQTTDPDLSALITTHFARLTPEWEMKMEYMLKPDGSLNFDAPDRILYFAQAQGLGVHGHCLIWFAQDNAPYFQSLKDQHIAFLSAYERYIQEVAYYFRGKLTGWDVVNEPISDKGTLRPCLWLSHLGEAYIDKAFRLAHQADPLTPLFLNDYDLESKPAKRLGFLRLAERLLKAGVPIHGLGTQTHMTANQSPDDLKSCIRDLASLGLKLHVSELDISIQEASRNPLETAGLRDKQRHLLDALFSAYHELAPAQKYGVTFWGVRDDLSWLNQHGWYNIPDEPCLFDRNGHLKALSEGIHA